MSHHTCRPGHPGIFADDCERCDELAGQPLHWDETRAERAWDLMLAIEMNIPGDGPHRRYETANEEKACRLLYQGGIWVERNLGIRPWRPFAELREAVRGR